LGWFGRARTRLRRPEDRRWARISARPPGRDSGKGSYGRLAEFKAQVLNDFVRERGVRSVIEFGCGDGNQLALADYPAYLGIDVSETAVRLCRARFAADPRKRFKLLFDYRGETADLALSLDVIYHLVEDDVFERYMNTLFAAAERFVIVYSTNAAQPADRKRPAHVRHRAFTEWIEANRRDFRLSGQLANRYPPGVRDGGETSPCSFFFYARQ
jgi:SAM-dependent methyltransferase